MGNIFSGSEIAELGIQIENNGRDFYGALAANSKELKTREIFAFLSGEEEKHIETFKKISASARSYKPKQAYPDEYFKYMSALAGDYVFTQKGKGKELAGKISGEGEALDLAIRFEKDSIVFYEGMKNVVPERDQGMVEELIRQERSHLVSLSRLKEELS
ncbi:MAG: ferritin family protein [Candidatus Omnitrophota bacterium]|jgi:rubrerythrin